MLSSSCSRISPAKEEHKKPSLADLRKQRIKEKIKNRIIQDMDILFQSTHDIKPIEPKLSPIPQFKQPRY